MSQPNTNVDEIQNMDLVTDEYGNYYVVVRIAGKEGKLTEVTLSHAYYEQAFSALIGGDLLKGYEHKHVGVFLQEMLSNRIANMESYGRKIFATEELFANGTKVSVMNLTELHPRAK